MAGLASVAKHPLHSMLVPLPIGLWIFSWVCDLIDVSSAGGGIWREMAFYTMAGGLVGSLLAAAPGLIDYGRLTDSWVKRIAMTHMGVNFAIIALFALNLWVRTQHPSNLTVAITLSTVSVLLLGITGWLGGELVYIHGVAVEPQHDIARKAREKKRRKLKLRIV